MIYITTVQRRALFGHFLSLRGCGEISLT